MSRKWRSGGAAGVLLLAFLAGAGAAPLPAPAPAPGPAPAPEPPIVRIGAAYIAKQVCSCLFVVGRSETSCRAEFKPDIDPFTVAIDRAGLPAQARVKATVGPVVGEATFARGYGCVVAR